MTMYLGDYAVSAMIDMKWNTNAVAGASITRATNGTIRIYKGNSLTERTSSVGITDTEDVDTLTGVHHLRIDTSDNTDAGFYAAGSEYQIVLAGATIDGQAINAVLAHFSIERSGGMLALLKTVISGTGVNVTAFGGTTLTQAGGRPEVNVSHWRGTAAATPTTAGIPKVAIEAAGDFAQAAADKAWVTATRALTDKVGFSLTTAEVDAIVDKVWDEARSGHLVAGSFGQGVASVQGNVTGAVASVTAAVTVGANNDKSGYTLTGGEEDAIADKVWDEALSGHTAAGSAGKALSDGAIPGIDPWTVPLPGSYASGTAGNIVGTQLDTAVSSRLASAAITLTGGAVTVGSNTDKSGYGLSPAERSASAAALLDFLDGIETGLTPRQALRLCAAVLGGRLAGALTSTVTIRNAVEDSKVRVSSTVDGDGNRQAVTYDLS